MSTHPSPAPRRRRRKRPNYWLRRLMVLLLLLSPALIWLGLSALRQGILPAEGSAPRVAANKPVYVLALGVDRRTEDTGRSDTIILVRLDPTAQSLHLIHIPRDTEVSLPEGGQSKINAAYAEGGPELVTRVVARLLDIPQPYYVSVDFASFEAIIDALGGVEITVDQHYQYEDPYQDLYIDIPPGRQVMYGRTALQYVRLRYDGATNSDIGRIQRQQQFIQALQAKLTDPSAWWKAKDLFKILRQYVTTNIPEADQLRLVESAFAARGNLKMDVLPGDFAGADWVLDQARWKDLVQSWNR